MPCAGWSASGSRRDIEFIERGGDYLFEVTDYAPAAQGRRVRLTEATRRSPSVVLLVRAPHPRGDRGRVCTGDFVAEYGQVHLPCDEQGRPTS